MKFTLSILAATACLALPVSAATLITNGGFEEAPALKGKFGATFGNMPTSGRDWDVWQNLPSWTTKEGQGIEIQTNRTLGSIDAHSGAYYVELDSHPSGGSNSTMEQSLVLKAGKYLLSFWYSPRVGNVDTTGITYSLGNLAVGDLVWGDVAGPSLTSTVGKWSEVVYEFTVKKKDTFGLRFAASGTADTYGGLIDDVALSYEAPAPVPLPAAGLLLLGGLGGLAAAKRRRKA